MPMQRFPLVGSINKRPMILASTSTVDQRFVGCYFIEVPNPVTGSKQVYCEKRSGLTGATVLSAGNIGGHDFFYSPSLDTTFAPFGTTNSTVFMRSGSVNLGTITGLVAHFAETLVGSVTHVLMTSTDQTAWYWASDATDTAISGDTHTNTTIDNITGLTGSLYEGQKITGSGIQAGTRIASVNSATSITTTIATTATATVNITVELVAKIIAANFPTNIVGGFAVGEGYAYIMTSTGRVYNSQLNNPAHWDATNYISADSCTDKGRGVINYKNMIVAFGNSSIEFFQNAGNPSGSVLNKAASAVVGIGASNVTNFNATSTLYCAGHDTVFWISVNRNIYALDGLTPKKISGPSMLISPILGLQAFSYSGKRFVNVTGGQGLTVGRWVDIDTGEINEPGFANATWLAGNDESVILYAIDNGTSGAIFNIYTSQQAVFTDNSVAYSMIIQTTKIDHGSAKRKFVTRVDLIADEQASGTTTLQYSDDDYTTWTDAGAFDMTKPQKSIFRLGSHKGGRAYRLTHSANTAWRGQFLDITFTEGTG